MENTDLITSQIKTIEQQNTVISFLTQELAKKNTHFYNFKDSFSLPNNPLIKEQYLYIIGAYEIIGTRFYKIGITNNIRNRLIEIQTGCPFKVFVVSLIIPLSNTLKSERNLHKMYKSRHTHGEWFILTKEDINNIIGRYKENRVVYKHKELEEINYVYTR